MNHKFSYFCSMLTNAQVKHIRSLQQKKFRFEHREYLIQGDKIVLEAIQSPTKPKLIVASETWIDSHEEQLENSLVEIANEKQLQQMSSLKNAASVIAIMPMHEDHVDLKLLSEDLVIALDFVQDPGNLGTILRIADWYGVRHVLCSLDTVDYTNPKVIQSTMGAFLRVEVHYVDLKQTISELLSQYPDYSILGSFMDGENMLNQKPMPRGMLIMGNEGQGISKTLEDVCSHRIAIPSFPVDNPSMESLNVAVATAILVSELRKPFQKR